MEPNYNSSHNSGVGIAGLLLVTFVVLKLCHVIEWPWLWVLAPLWISGIIIIGIVIAFVCIEGRKR